MSHLFLGDCQNGALRPESGCVGSATGRGVRIERIGRIEILHHQRMFDFSGDMQQEGRQVPGRKRRIVGRHFVLRQCLRRSGRQIRTREFEPDVAREKKIRIDSFSRCAPHSMGSRSGAGSNQRFISRESWRHGLPPKGGQTHHDTLVAYGFRNWARCKSPTKRFLKINNPNVTANIYTLGSYLYMQLTFAGNNIFR